MSFIYDQVGLHLWEIHLFTWLCPCGASRREGCAANYDQVAGASVNLLNAWMGMGWEKKEKNNCEERKMIEDN